MTKALIEQTFALKDIKKAAELFAQQLCKASIPFIVGFEAEMGVGKTTFTREVLYALGVDPREPVLSPTFTYIHEYETANGLFGHLDLYRLEHAIDLEELIGRDLDEFKGLFIEWPELGGGLAHLGCHFLIKGKSEGLEQRSFALYQI